MSRRNVGAKVKAVQSAPRAKPLRGDRRGKALDRGRQMIRQWKALAALRAASRGLTIKELKEAVDEPCSERTLYRDVEQLQASGFGVRRDGERWFCDRGAEQLPFQPDDVAALSQVLKAYRHTGTVWEQLSSLRERLYAALSPEGRAFCTDLEAHQLITLPASLPAPLAHLAAIEEAVSKDHLLRIAYQPARGKPASERIVAPYGTWHASGQTYLVADCRKAKAFRTFHVARVQRAEVLEEEFDRDSAFDIEGYRERAFRVMSGAVERVVLELSSEVEHLAKERVIHPSQRVEVRDGRTCLILETGGMPELAAWIAGSGGEIRVLEPAVLAELVRGIHLRGLSPTR
ncbi:MAG: helix-turn-helix transcriptional regulator [Polyangiaceae bacterium]